MKHVSSILILALVTVAGCDGFTSVSGRVTNPLGQPVPGATVILEALPTNGVVRNPEDMPVGSGALSRSATTAHDGTFALGMTDSPYGSPDQISVQKKGYKLYSEQVKSSTKIKDHAIVLVPETESPRENAQQDHTR